MKNIALIPALIACILVGCGSTQTKAPAYTLPENAQFSVPAVTVKLTQKIDVDGYPDQEALTDFLRKKTEAALKSNGLLAQADATEALAVNIEVDYQRRFAGEDTPMPSKSVTAPLVHYQIIISQNGMEKHRIEKSGMTVNKGFGANLKTTFTMGLGKTSKDEEQDLETLANGFVSDLKQLRK